MESQATTSEQLNLRCRKVILVEVRHSIMFASPQSEKNLNLISEFLSDFSVNFSQDAATKLSGHQEESNEKTKR